MDFLGPISTLLLSRRHDQVSSVSGNHPFDIQSKRWAEPDQKKITKSCILELQNDLKIVMLQIEEAIHAIHAEAIAEKQRKDEEKKLQTQSNLEHTSASASTSSTSSASNAGTSVLSKPFAKVNMVAPDSPAREAVSWRLISAIFLVVLHPPRLIWRHMFNFTGTPSIWSNCGIRRYNGKDSRHFCST